MNLKSELDPELESRLGDLRRTAPRDPQLAARARETFLAEAARMAPAVSNSPRNRLEGWKETFTTFRHVFRKEKNPMFNFLMTVVLVLGAILGGGGTAVAAAQAAQPQDALYQVKTWSEEVRLGWESDPQAKFDLAFQFTARRAEEIETGLAAGRVAPEPVVNRFENQQQLALQYAINLPDSLALPALEQIRDQARRQEQLMRQLQLADPACEQLRERVQSMLQTQARNAQAGLDDPVQLRNQLRLHERLQPGNPTAVPSGTGPATVTGGNPWTTGTPTPGSGYGPGPGTCDTCTPMPHNNQPAQPPQHQPGNGGSNTNPAPRPGSGSGSPAAPGGTGSKP